MAEVKIYNQDCMEAMAKMKDGEYSLAIVDPPYGINVGTPLSGERERERITSRPLALKGKASPKFIGDLMIVKSPHRNTLVN